VSRCVHARHRTYLFETPQHRAAERLPSASVALIQPLPLKGGLITIASWPIGKEWPTVVCSVPTGVVTAIRCADVVVGDIEEHHTRRSARNLVVIATQQKTRLGIAGHPS
jgi:hypothetical protein